MRTEFFVFLKGKNKQDTKTILAEKIENQEEEQKTLGVPDMPKHKKMFNCLSSQHNNNNIEKKNTIELWTKQQQQ